MATTKNKTAETVSEETEVTEVTEVTEETVQESPYDRVELFVPKGNINDEPNLLISVNGKNFLLPKGKKSMVPRYIKDEFDRSQRAQEIADEHIDEMIEATKQPTSYK